MFFRAFLLAALAVACGAAELPRRLPPPPPPAPPPTAHPLTWDATLKTHRAEPGEEKTTFTFTATNTADHEVEIIRINPSCGCTVAEMPDRPWVLAPGKSGSFRATMDFKGKHGKLSKALLVESSHGSQSLTIAVEIPEADHETRLRNQELARANRQLVFQGDCASCHAAPLAGKTGSELFEAACGICHLAKERAEIVPDLFAAQVPRDAAYWQKWISEGKDATLMPAFAQRHGGPLDDAQIQSLVEFLLTHSPKKAAAE